MPHIDNILARLIIIALVIYATSLHELAHAWVATWCGDPTPGRYGRLTWNPIPHLSPVMTAIVLPVIFYLGAHSLFILALTPINPSKFRKPLRDHALVAAAGPATNFVLTGIILGLLRIPGVYGVFWQTGQRPATAIVLPWVGFWIYFMGIFNLLPLPPLDGYWIVRGLLPLSVRQQSDALARSEFSFFIVMIVGTILFQFQFIDDFIFNFYIYFLPPLNVLGG